MVDDSETFAFLYRSPTLSFCQKLGPSQAIAVAASRLRATPCHRICGLTPAAIRYRRSTAVDGKQEETFPNRDHRFTLCLCERPHAWYRKNLTEALRHGVFSEMGSWDPFRSAQVFRVVYHVIGSLGFSLRRRCSDRIAAGSSCRRIRHFRRTIARGHETRAVRTGPSRQL